MLKTYTISILGCGWLGFALAKRLVAKELHVVKGSTTTSDKMSIIREAGIIPFMVNLNSPIPKAFLECEKLVITVPPSSGNYESKMKLLVKQIKDVGIQKVIFVSTTSVYPNSGGVVVEKDADYIRSPHSGMIMLEIEDIFKNETSFSTTILRFAGLYGPGRAPGRFLANKKGLKGAKNLVNLIHQDDCVDIIIKIMEEECWGEVFNACADEHPERQRFYTQAALSLGLAPPTFSNQPSPFKVISSEKLKSKLSYRFIHPDPMKDV